MKRTLRALAAALAYFTVLPGVRAAGPPDADAFAFLPLVGLLVGALAGAIGAVAARVLHAPWGVAATIAASILLTGALHLDGYLDCADALPASVGPQRRQEILRDPRHGTYALAGLAILVLAWSAALARIAPARLPLVVAFAAGAARLAVLPLPAWLGAAGGATARAIAGRPIGWLALPGLIGVLLVGYFVAPFAALLVVPLAVLALVAARYATRRLGGLNGDVYGAIVCILEVAALAAIPLLTSN